MKNLLLLGFLISYLALSGESFHQLEAQSIKGKKVSFSTFKGKTVMVVNIASRCGFTPQLETLQQLYERFRDKGLVVVGVPSNEFGGQSPEADSEMSKFCKLNYGVNFPLLSKTSVKGKNKHPVFKHLIGNSKNNEEISWNFEKFLIDRNGKLVKRFRSGDSPLGDKVVNEIKRTLENS